MDYSSHQIQIQFFKEQEVVLTVFTKYLMLIKLYCV